MDKGASAFALTNNTLKPVLGKKKKIFYYVGNKTYSSQNISVLEI